VTNSAGKWLMLLGMLVLGMILIQRPSSQVIVSDRETWPEIPPDWKWLPETDEWLAYKGGDGFPIPFFEFLKWKYGWTSDQWQYFVFLCDLEEGRTISYENTYRYMPDKDRFPDWKSYFEHAYTKDLSLEQIAEVELEDRSFRDEFEELWKRVGDELTMRLGMDNAEPRSKYYREHWYVFYRYCSGPVAKYAKGSIWRLFGSYGD